MATINIKYSWFQAQTNEKRAKNVKKRYMRKIQGLDSIIYNSERFGIPLSEETTKGIKDKKHFYSRQIGKLSHFIYMLKQKDKKEALKYIEGFYTKEELDKHKTDTGVLKILKKIKNLF